MTRPSAPLKKLEKDVADGLLRFEGGENVYPTAIEYYNPKTGHAVLEFTGVEPTILEKGSEKLYQKRYLYWATAPGTHICDGELRGWPKTRCTVCAQRKPSGK